MAELSDELFMTNLSNDQLAGIVPRGLSLEDLSGIELLNWTEMVLPNVYAADSRQGMNLSVAVIELCRQQSEAARSLGRRQEAVAYANTSAILQGGVMRREFGGIVLKDLLATYG